MDEDWDKQKDKILGAMGPEQNVTDITMERQKMSGAPLSFSGRTSLDNVEMAYARDLYIYTEATLKGKQKCIVFSLRLPLECVASFPV